jgi:hypothetical protein
MRLLRPDAVPPWGVLAMGSCSGSCCSGHVRNPDQTGRSHGGELGRGEGSLLNGLGRAAEPLETPLGSL